MGGSWNNNPRNARVSNRNRNEPDNHNNNRGFRCVGQYLPNRHVREPFGIPVPAGRHARFWALVPANRRRAGAKYQTVSPLR